MRRSLRAVAAAALTVTLTLVGCAGAGGGLGDAGRAATTSGLRAGPGAAAAPALSVGARAWVAVSVATLWRSARSPRAVDAPALANPARVAQWLGTMTLAQRRSLGGRADTQALLGDEVRVVQLRATWAKVVVPSQPSQLDDRGYPGWVPRRQLTAVPPVASAQVATVVARTAWLRADRPGSAGLLRVSFGTRLPVVGETGSWVRVAAPTGTVRRLARSVVVLHRPGTPALAPSPAGLVTTARAFVGLPYLWAGLSGFGLDCSGLVWLDYRVHGITVPRDALPESQGGAPVTGLRRGDLMFYATAGRVHHVSMYAGGGLMVHAPGTGQRVQVVATSTPAYRSEYVGARRYLP